MRASGLGFRPGKYHLLSEHLTASYKTLGTQSRLRIRLWTASYKALGELAAANWLGTALWCVWV